MLDSSMISLLRKPGDFCSLLHERTSQQAAMGLKLFNSEPWDLFFLQFDTLDYAQHTLWRYSDPGDPGYPGRNRFTYLIPDFYRLFDRIIGSFRAAMQQDCVLVVVSGYGFSRRCIYRLQLNEWLRTRGLLTPGSSSLHDGKALVKIHPVKAI
jgi:predicted AlkP superfamily phosphohydrolase/phosphomutase